MKRLVSWINAAIKIITTSDTYRYILRIAWLFFPSIIFLFLCWFAFWNISQGRDLMIYTLRAAGGICLFHYCYCFFLFYGMVFFPPGDES